MNFTNDFFAQMHELWWIVLLAVCIAAAVAILFGIAMERMRQKDPEPPYRLDFDEFYRNDNDNRKD